MKPYTTNDLEAYLKQDIILEELKKFPEDVFFASHKWLLDIPVKRMIYEDVYGSFLKNEKGKKILDIGGGFCGLSRELIKNHDYTLVDIMVHDDHERLKVIEKELKGFWVNTDWDSFQPDGNYDYIIANDLFPNVDQRIEKFLKKYLPISKTLIATLTCYDSERSYRVKRLDADEILTIRPWDTNILSAVMASSYPNIVLEPLGDQDLSPFSNKRSVYKAVWKK